MSPCPTAWSEQPVEVHRALIAHTPSSLCCPSRQLKLLYQANRCSQNGSWKTSSTSLHMKSAHLCKCTTSVCWCCSLFTGIVAVQNWDRSPQPTFAQALCEAAARACLRSTLRQRQRGQAIRKLGRWHPACNSGVGIAAATTE